MKRFSRIYSGEIFKIFTKKTLIGLAVGFIILFAFSIFTIEMISSVSEASDIIQEELNAGQGDETVMPELSGETLDLAIEQVEQRIAELKLEIETDRKLPLNERQRFSTMPGELYGLNASLKAMEYCRDNNLAFNVEDTTLQLNTASFALSFALSFLSLIAIIFAITASARSIAEEWKRGTLKMTLIRPIKREELLGAKMLASFTAGIMVFVFGLIVMSVYVLIRFGANAPEMLFVFNARNAFMASSALSVVLQCFDVVISIAVYVSLTAFIAVLLKNTAASIILPLISFLGVVSSLFTLAGIGAYSLSSNLSTLNGYFTVSNAPLHGMNFWWSLIAIVIYLSLFISVSFIAFKKKDIA